MVIKRFYWVLIVLLILCRQTFSKNLCEKTFEGNLCKRLNKKTCLTGNLTYNFTSSIFLLPYLNESRELSSWTSLESVPRCWDAVRPVLCAIYLPRCDYDARNNKSIVQLPKKKMCDFIKEPCKVVEELNLWPAYLNCSHYSEGCNDNVADIKFLQTSSCKYPLINTNNSMNWYPGFEGCSFTCQNPWFTKEDHDRVHFTILIFCLSCIACNFFVVLTFGFNWKRLNCFPDVIILYMNVCYMVSSLGWLFQFIPDVRNSVTCEFDGTAKTTEFQFKYDESYMCVIVFVLIYFFSLASVAWFVVLTYSWQIAFETSRTQVQRKKTYFHLGVWVLSIVLTVVCIAFTEVDGDTLTGICFITSKNFSSRGIFVLVPMTLAWIAGLVFLGKGLIVLVNMKSQSPDFLSKQRNKKLQSSIMRIGIFIIALMAFGITFFGLNIHVFLNFDSWNESMKNFIICRSNLTGNIYSNSDCSITKKPNISFIQLSIFCYFGFGVLLSSWLWKLAAFRSWKYFLLSSFVQIFILFRCEKGKSILEENNNLYNAISESEDIIGMDFDLNSMTSFDVSSLSSILMSNRRHSDSDVSFFEKKIIRSANARSKRENSLSSSEWSGSESQKSHFSYSYPIYYQSSEDNCAKVKNIKFRKEKGYYSLLEKKILNPLGSVLKLYNTTCDTKELLRDFIPLKRQSQIALLFDFNSFRSLTMSFYEQIEEDVSCNREENVCMGYSDTFDRYEKLFSSGSNFSLASSDTDILSINFAKDCQPHHSLVGKENSKKFKDKAIFIHDGFYCDRNRFFNCGYQINGFSTATPLCEKEPDQSIYNRKRYMSDVDSISTKFDGMSKNDAIVCQKNYISIYLRDSDDGDDSSNISDYVLPHRNTNKISLVRRKRYLTLNNI